MGGVNIAQKEDGVSKSGQRSPWIARGIGIAIAAVIGIAIIATTTYTTVEQGAAVAAGLNPDKSFDPAAKAAELFPQIQAGLPEKAVDMSTFLADATANREEAAKKFGVDLGAGSYAVPLVVKGKVIEADDKFLTLEVAGASADVPVRIPLSSALNGGPVRDALGIISFGDVPDQIAFQSLAQELKALMKSQVVDQTDTGALTGKDVVIYGAWASQSPESSWVVQPVVIEAAP